MRGRYRQLSGRLCFRPRWHGPGVLLFVLMLSSVASTVRAESVLFETAIDAPSMFTSAEWGYDLRPTTDGGIVLCGFTTASFLPLLGDALLVKTDSEGDTLWTRRYGGEQGDDAHAVVECTGGGFALGGTTQSASSSADFYLVRTDSTGTLLWSRNYGGSRIEICESLYETADGGFLLAGSTYSFGMGDSDVYVVRTNAIGDTLWTRTYGGSGRDGASSITMDASGRIAVAGFTTSFGTDFYDLYVLCLDANGEVLWEKTFGGVDEDFAGSITATRDGGFFVAGTTERIPFSGFSGRAWALRLDTVGSIIWERRFGGLDGDDANGHDAIQASDGTFLVAGSTLHGSELRMLLWKLKTNGDTAWSRELGPNGQTTTGTAVAEIEPGVFAATGYTTRPATWYDLPLAAIQDEITTDAPETREVAGRLRFYPNPVQTTARVAVKPYRASGPCEAVLFDAAGRLLRTWQAADIGSLVLDRRGLAAGIYFCEVRARSGFVWRSRVSVR